MGGVEQECLLARDQVLFVLKGQLQCRGEEVEKAFCDVSLAPRATDAAAKIAPKDPANTSSAATTVQKWRGSRGS